MGIFPTVKNTSQMSNGSGGQTQIAVTQNSHGFLPLDWVRYDESTSNWVKAQANTVGGLGSWHVVSVTDANTFLVSKDGTHTIPNALTPGEYVLSDSTAGGYTQTLPTTGTSYILYGMEVINSTTVNFYTVVGVSVASTGGVSADNVSYDNVTSGLSATDVQAAIDEIEAGISSGIAWGYISSANYSITGTSGSQNITVPATAKVAIINGTTSTIQSGMPGATFDAIIAKSGKTTSSNSFIDNGNYIFTSMSWGANLVVSISANAGSFNTSGTVYFYS